jgi:N-acetylglucosaminyl-diphospho-decaprenol L-rhamnosyltransferase
MVDISVIVVTYNSERCVGACLGSILRQKEASFEVIVIDNASSDDTLQSLRKDGVSVVESKENIGFGRACNLGFSQSRGKFVLCLNPDAELVDDCALREICQKMERNPQWGLAGTKVISHAGHPESPPALEYPGQKHVRRDFSKLPGDIAWVIGASMVVRRDVYQQLGGFDPDYFLYSEETDLCLRTRELGYAVGWMEDVVVRHIGGESEKHADPYSVSRRKLTGLLTFRSKHYTRDECVLLARRDLNRALFRMVTNRIQAIFRGRKSEHWAKHRMYRGIWEMSRQHLEYLHAHSQKLE